MQHSLGDHSLLTLSKDSTLKKNRVITIGLVIKDCENTVREAVLGVVRQTYPHESMEIIVVDGQSTDNTLSIVRKVLSSTDIRSRIFFDEGKGMAAARQIAVDEAQGEYLVWVDGDDVISERYVQRLVEFMDANARLGGAKAHRVIEDNHTLIAKLENLDLALRTTSGHVFDGHGILRLVAIREVGGFDPQIRGAGEDVDLIRRMRESGWLYSVSPVSFYHMADSWITLWEGRFRAGYWMHYLNRKHKGLIKLWRLTPLVVAAVGLRETRRAYKLTYQKVSFLLPFYHVLRSVPWWIGFVESHIDGCGHNRT